MSTASSFFGCVARAVVRIMGNAVGAGVLGDVLMEVGSEVWEAWRGTSDAAALRGELEAVAQAAPSEILALADAAVAALSPSISQELRDEVRAYLTQIPAAVRRTFRRPGEPSGRTAPAGLPLAGPADLLPLLPERLPRFRPGQTLRDGSRELVELLGAGGFGEVWKARNPDRPRAPATAIKFCLDTAAAATLRNEADLLDRITAEGTHPGLVRLLDTGLRSDPPFVEYEYVEGGDLGGLIRERHAAGSATPEWAAGVMLQLADAVGFAHRLAPPIVHRDLKPANILVRPDGGLRVADFGIGAAAVGQAVARRTMRTGGHAGHVRRTELLGAYTPNYASPQQMRGEQPAPRDDVYSLGVIWHQLLTGRLDEPAPTGDWAEDLRDEGVPDAHVRLIGACLSVRPEKRPADAAELAARLRSPTPPWASPDKTPAAAPPPAPIRRAAPPAPPTPPSRDELVAILARHFDDVPNCYVFPNIPYRKARNVRSLLSQHIKPGETVLMVYDGTMFGGAKDGFACTDAGIGWRFSPFDPAFFRPYTDLRPDTFSADGYDLKFAPDVDPAFVTTNDMAKVLPAVRAAVAVIRSRLGL